MKTSLRVKRICIQSYIFACNIEHLRDALVQELHHLTSLYSFLMYSVIGLEIYKSIVYLLQQKISMRLNITIG